MQDYSMKRGMFIVFEGIDGAGTTTQCGILAKRLDALEPGRGVTITAEPTTRPVGGLIREVLGGRLVSGESRSGDGTSFDRRALALLFAADRLDHVTGEIEPMLDRGDYVISDRYVLSSIAYQGMDAPVEWVSEINRFAPGPDLTFFLDVPADLAWQRIQASRPDREIFETQRTLEKVVDAYREAVRVSEQKGIISLDGTLSVDEVAARVWDVVEEAITGSDHCR